MLSFPLGKETIHGRQAVRQVLPFLLGKAAFLPRQLLTFLLGKEAVSPWQLLTFLPGEGSNSPLATAHLPTREGSSSLPATAQLPPREVSSSSQATAHLLPGEGNSSSQSTTLPSLGEEVAILRQANKLGQAGRVLGILPGIGHPRLSMGTALPPRKTVLTPRKATPLLPFPVGFPKGLLMKNLTLSGSLTYPANL